MEQEVFVPINGYEELYEISNYGRIKSLPRTWVTGERFGVRSKQETILKTSVQSNGYVRCVLCKESIRKAYSVHVLVAGHFCENINNLPVVNHENSIRHDNFYRNLTWTTHQGNVIHGFEKGFMKGANGTKNPRAKYTDDQVIEIRRLFKEGCLQKEIALKFNCKQQSISKIITRQRWSHI